MARDAEQDDLLAARSHPGFVELQRFLRGLGPADGHLLVAHVEGSALRRVDDRTRRLALRLIGDAIRRVKARQGLDDVDPLPGEPESARQACARLLRERLL